MTITETRPEAEAAHGAHSAVATAVARPAPQGIAGWLLTADHKRIGRLYVGFSLLFLLAALVIGFLLGLERISDDDISILKAGAIGQLYSAYGIGLVFFVALPLLLGIAIAVVPLQVGARGVAFPRAAALSFWVWLVGATVTIGAYAGDGGPFGGKTKSVSMFLAAFIVAVAGLLLAAVCVATTVLTLRAPGMTLDRVPLFSWSSMVMGTMLLASLPVLIGDLIYLFVDHRYGGTVFGSSNGIGGLAGSPDGWTSWALLQPQIYLLLVPVLGFVADVAPVFARTRQAMAVPLRGVIGLAGLVGFGAWVQPMIYSGVLHTGFLKAWCIVAILPPLAVLALTGLTLRTGRPRAGAPLLWGVVGVLIALATVVGGVFWPYDKLRLVGSVFEQGVLELATLAAVLVGLGAIVYWGPKLYGRRVPDGAASGLAVLGLLAVALLALPNIALGFWKQPAASVGPFDINGPKALLNLLSTAGCALLFVVVVAAVLLGLRAFSRGDLAGDDPWDGNTLEWATSSPPPDTNFAELAVVSSPEPLLDLKTARETA